MDNTEQNIPIYLSLLAKQNKTKQHQKRKEKKEHNLQQNI